MRLFPTRSALAVLACLLLGTQPRADEEKVALDKVPRAVLDSVKAKFPGAKLLGATKEKDGDKIAYEISLKYKDAYHDVTVEPGGKILDIEKTITFKDLPKAVLKAAQGAFPEAKIVGAAKEVDGGETTFEVEMEQEGKSIDLAVDDEGEIEEVEREIEVEDLPRAVIKAAKAKFPGSKIVSVEEVSDEDDVVVYELAFEVEAGKTMEVVFSPNGKVKGAPKGEEKDEPKPKD